MMSFCENTSTATHSDSGWPSGVSGQFLVLGRDVGRMASWLRDVCEISALNASEIAQALEAKAAKIVVL